MLPAVIAALDDQFPFAEVFQVLRNWMTSSEHLRDLLGVGGRELKENVRANCLDRGAHAFRKLIQELVRCANRDAKLTRFRKVNIEISVRGQEVLDFICIHGEDRAAGSAKNRRPKQGEDQASER